MTADQLEALTPGLSRVVIRSHPFAKCCFCQSPLVLIAVSWWCPRRECRDIQRKYAIVLRRESEDGFEDTFWHVPLPKQAKVEMQTAPNVMYAGAAGPGKSHWGRRRLIRRAMAYEGYNGLIVRRQLTEVTATHVAKLRNEIKDLQAAGIVCKLRPKFLEFPQTGGVIHFAHISTEKALESLLSPEYDDILLDEASRNKAAFLPKLMARARSTNPAIIADGGSKALPVTNPGGEAAGYLKDMFITHTPDYETYPNLIGKYKPEDWVYIEATLDDNPYLEEDYADKRLAGLDAITYEQQRNANWDVFDGMAFPDWKATKAGQPWHVQKIELAA